MYQDLNKSVFGVLLLTGALAGCSASVDEYQLDTVIIESEEMEEFWVAKESDNKMAQAMAGLACLGPMISMSGDFVDAYNTHGNVEDAGKAVMQEAMGKKKNEDEKFTSATITVSESEIGWKSTDLKLQMPNGVGESTPFPELEASLSLTKFNGHTVLRFDTKDVVCNIPVVKL